VQQTLFIVPFAHNASSTVSSYVSNFRAATTTDRERCEFPSDATGPGVTIEQDEIVVTTASDATIAEVTIEQDEIVVTAPTDAKDAKVTIDQDTLHSFKVGTTYDSLKHLQNKAEKFAKDHFFEIRTGGTKLHCYRGYASEFEASRERLTNDERLRREFRV